MEDTKICKICLEEKSIFSFASKGGNQRKTRCNKCLYKVHMKNKPNKIKIETRKRLLKHNYNITLEQYDNMFIQQKGCCAICNLHQTKQKTRLAVDHCHITGKVRGLLCNACNRGMGLLKDNIQILLSAAEYLQK